MPKAERSLPPPAPTDATSCVYGGSNPTRGWRWFPALGRWERVCARHYTGLQFQHGLYIPDVLKTERQEPQRG